MPRMFTVIKLKNGDYRVAAEKIDISGPRGSRKLSKQLASEIADYLDRAYEKFMPSSGWMRKQRAEIEAAEKERERKIERHVRGCKSCQKELRRWEQP